MTPLFRKALSAADKVRMDIGLDMFEPLNIYDLCAQMELTVRFVELNMEGMYFTQDEANQPLILLSNQRPFARRCYTCAHELGHHVFGHGTKVDTLINDEGLNSSKDDEELLVDAFAGALLMPTAGVIAEFAQRGWNPEKATPIQFFVISSAFGTGYQTLISHCWTNRIISQSQASALAKWNPAKILKGVVPAVKELSHFKIVDGRSPLSVIDLEVSNYIILPNDMILEGEQLQLFQETSLGTAYIATRSGIVRAICPKGTTAYFIRVQKCSYVGLAEYRHLESETETD